MAGIDQGHGLGQSRQLCDVIFSDHHLLQLGQTQKCFVINGRNLVGGQVNPLQLVWRETRADTLRHLISAFTNGSHQHQSGKCITFTFTCASEHPWSNIHTFSFKLGGNILMEAKSDLLILVILL